MSIFASHVMQAAKARIEALRATRPAKASKDSLEFIEWCCKHIKIRGVAWSLKHHEYLEELYKALIDHPYVVIEKAAQVGVSTAVLLACFYQCDDRGVKAIYYLSTDDDADDFSQDRINLAIDDSEYLQEIVKERKRARDNVGLRHVGRGSLFCRGMFTKRKVKSVDADILVLDELDEADQENKQFALDRIMHSSLQHVRELSQPSIPDYGIDETFSRSDQRYWHLKCPACKKYTCLELALEERDKRPVPVAIKPVPKNATWTKPDQRWYRACLHCEAPLDMARGEWVSKHPSQRIRGYHMSQLYTQIPAAGFADPADKLMEAILGAHKTRERLRVSVSIIGFPYAGDRQPITDEVLDKAEGDQGFAEGAVDGYMGVDQGDLLHVAIGVPARDGLRVAHLEVTDDWGRLLELARNFGVRVMAIDALPNKHDAKGICKALEALPGSRKGFIQYFRDTPIKREEEGEGARAVKKVTVDRTESLDETTRALQEQDILLPAMAKLSPQQLRTYEIFRAQCKMLVKDLEESASGVTRWVYKSKVPNHFGMALNSMRIAREISPYAAYYDLGAANEDGGGSREGAGTVFGGVRGMSF